MAAETKGSGNAHVEPVNDVHQLGVWSHRSPAPGSLASSRVPPRQPGRQLLPVTRLDGTPVAVLLLVSVLLRGCQTTPATSRKPPPGLKAPICACTSCVLSARPAGASCEACPGGEQTQALPVLRRYAFMPISVKAPNMKALPATEMAASPVTSTLCPTSASMLVELERAIP
eukprot:CAMPEP_0206009156 /NCGR_PEP_ID=MMETSP1464-20131121/9071_1 /ASSEMBLY_ACC=CAM_ASM_001124 /TAXON_ID=119497 /ORGANISM="Exanthemachrysis gayraliae, Strain RCC1523" /LENGTH=171 /DNA_ID=CAMNT_0053382745 /DNA_START=208 /DNA_END=721 /DNA_ORIENTATION=+